MNKGRLKTVKGDATCPQMTSNKEIVMIPHVCNNGGKSGVGVMGAGVALALRNKWSKVFEVYQQMQNRSSDGLTKQLGNNCYAKINEYLVVVNMIAQNGTVSADNPKPIKYEALISCMRKTVDYIEMIKKQVSNPVVIHACKFGSDLAGGTWGFILELIDEIWLEAGINVVVYEFEK